MNYSEVLGKELPQINPKIWLEAECFYEIGMSSFDKMEKALAEDTSISEKMYLLPATVNMAFACELYLKSLLTDTTGHDLKTLFDKQADVIKSVIKNSIISNMENYSESIFEHNLEEIKDVFPTWRYYYEPDKDGLSLNIEFLKLFATALHSLKELYK